MEASSRYSMTGKVAMVTGGTRNIGLATARVLGLAGADLVITGQSHESVSQAEARLREETGRDVLGIPADVRDVDQMEDAARQAIARYGLVDVVINNALVVAKNPIQETVEGRSILSAPREFWDEGIDGFIHGPLAALRVLVPAMQEAGNGAIVNLVSTANFRVIPGLGVYGTVKSAMWSWTQHLALELAPTIRVNAVCPGTVTEDGELELEVHKALIDQVPLNRMGRADEVAEAVMYLASDASTYTTGQVLHVNGGRVALA
ncbi:MAG: SDR family NAD(P)-dependent oxidoreductase [Actinomycetes bacterium]